MKMYIGGFKLGAIECDLEDVIDEMEEFPEAGESKEGESFIGLENDDGIILNIVKLGENNWAVVAGDSERDGVHEEDLKKIVEDFFNGILPEWSNNADRNDFPDGIDDILSGEW